MNNINTFKYDYSVIILTYNSDFSKTKKTINSILKQTNVSYEIIIADDGSRCTNFEEIENYFHEIHFTNYKLLTASKNRGTVINLYNAVQQAEGQYVKDISPGDFLFDSNVLNKILKLSKNENAPVCFGRALHYLKNENSYETIDRKNPYFIKPYIQKSSKQIRHNYLVSRDPLLGAALIFDTMKLLNYLQLIIGKAIYCEDSVLNLFAAKGEKISFYDDYFIFYETNVGISSVSNMSKWGKLIYEDNKKVFSYLLSEHDISYLEYLKSFSSYRKIRIILSIILDGRNTFFKRFQKTSDTVLSMSHEYLNLINEMTKDIQNV